jgi:CDGSH-type Zn-finger protein
MLQEADVAVKITPLDNGPYMVEGEIELLFPSGQPIPVRGSKAFLCRCGASTRKPLCDGTHSRIFFQAAESSATKRDGGA